MPESLWGSPGIPPEFLSSPEGCRGVRRSFDGSGGWFYDARARSFGLNVGGTVRQLLKPYSGLLADTKPSEWEYQEVEDMSPDTSENVLPH